MAHANNQEYEPDPIDTQDSFNNSSSLTPECEQDLSDAHYCDHYGCDEQATDEALVNPDLYDELSQGQGIDRVLNQSSMLETIFSSSSAAQDLCDTHGLWIEHDLSAASSIAYLDQVSPAKDECQYDGVEHDAQAELQDEDQELKAEHKLNQVSPKTTNKTNSSEKSLDTNVVSTNTSEASTDLLLSWLNNFTSENYEAPKVQDSERLVYVARTSSDDYLPLTDQLWQINQLGDALQANPLANITHKATDKIQNVNMYLYPTLVVPQASPVVKTGPNFHMSLSTQVSLFYLIDRLHMTLPSPVGLPFCTPISKANSWFLEPAQVLSFVSLAYERAESLKIDNRVDHDDYDIEDTLRDDLPTAPIVKPPPKEPYVSELDKAKIRFKRRKARLRELRHCRLETFVEAALGQGVTLEDLSKSNEDPNKIQEQQAADNPVKILDLYFAKFLAEHFHKSEAQAQDGKSGQETNYSSAESAQQQEEDERFSSLNIPFWMEVALSAPDEVPEEYWDDEELAPFMRPEDEKLFDQTKWFQALMVGEVYEGDIEIPFYPNELEPYFVELSKTFETNYKSRAFASSMMDLGVQIRDALQDPNVTEIMVNTDEMIFVESSVWGVQRIGKLESVRSESLMRILASLMEINLDLNQPILSCELPKMNARFEGLLPPLANNPAFSIRRHHFQTLTLQELQQKQMMTERQSQLLLQALDKHLSIVICGPTGSGKTTLLNCLICEIAERYKYERIVTIEDTPELRITSINKLNLYTSDYVDMSDLVRSSLRLRPDRLIVGEVRGAEALDLIDAFSTGHRGGLTSVHAGSIEQALSRLTLLVSRHPKAPRQIELTIGSAIDLIVVIQRRPFRHISQIARVLGYKPQGFVYEIWDDQESKDSHTATQSFNLA